MEEAPLCFYEHDDAAGVKPLRHSLCSGTLYLQNFGLC